ncbi:MAG: ribonuclease III [Clostridia bacterium]|nr:ribonuclease III [Clostridia bacterium]
MTLNLNLSRNDNNNYRTWNGLSLAFVGDAVYELMVRNMLTDCSEHTVNDLHKQCVQYVNADYQAEAMDRLLPLLTEEEITFFKRGRNAKSAHVPKNKTQANYHKATGFEALFGYLFLKGDSGRLTELFNITVNKEDAS